MTVQEEYDELYGKEIKKYMELVESEKEMKSKEGKELLKKNQSRLICLLLKGNDFLINAIKERV